MPILHSIEWQYPGVWVIMCVQGCFLAERHHAQTLSTRAICAFPADARHDEGGRAADSVLSGPGHRGRDRVPGWLWRSGSRVSPGRRLPVHGRDPAAPALQPRPALGASSQQRRTSVGARRRRLFTSSRGCARPAVHAALLHSMQQLVRRNQTCDFCWRCGEVCFRRLVCSDALWNPVESHHDAALQCLQARMCSHPGHAVALAEQGMII